MTEEQQKKIKNRLTLLTVGVIALLAILLIVLVATKKMNTVWFPIGAGVILGLYWIVVDVLPVIWLHQFADKTDAQKRSYYIYALIDAVGLGGLLYFIMSLTSMTGALVYVASVFLKKRFHDEYLGVSEEETEDGAAADKAGTEKASAEPELQSLPESTPAEGAEDQAETSLEEAASDGAESTGEPEDEP